MKSKRTDWAKTAAIVALGALLIGSCSESDDGVGPQDDEEFDPAQTQVALDGIADDFFTENPATMSITGVSGCYVDAVGVVSRLGVDSDTGPMGLLGAVGKHLLGIGEPARLAGSAAQIPEELLGKTLVMDPGTGSCGPDLSRMDAPPDGLRLELYETDPAGAVVMPLNPNGYVDLRDNSTESTLDISFMAVVNGQTLIQYSIDATVTETAFDLDVDGFFSDGTEQLTFGAAADFTATETNVAGSASFNASASGLTFAGSLNADVSIENETGSGSGGISVTEGGNTTGLTASVTEQGAVSAEVRFNNQLVMMASGNIDDEMIDFTDPAGNPVPQADLDALEAIIQGAGEVVEAAAGVLAVSALLFGGSF